MNSAVRADRRRGWEGRANRSRLGLFASYRVGVKINVNFAVELISPAPINPTNSLSPVPPSPSPSLPLSLCLSISRSHRRVSLYIFSSFHVWPSLPTLHYEHFLSSYVSTPFSLPQAF